MFGFKLQDYQKHTCIYKNQNKLLDAKILQYKKLAEAKQNKQ
jgi:hypothetical protein